MSKAEWRAFDKQNVMVPENDIHKKTEGWSMKAKRVTSRVGRKGWRFRITNPATRRRTWRTFWFTDLRDATNARDKFLEGFERRKLGIADYSGSAMPFEDAVAKFLKEAPLTSGPRRNRLQHCLECNELGLTVLGDLNNRGKLTAQCVSLVRKHGDLYVRRRIQQPLKQLASWAASVDLLSHNPLSVWKFIPRTSVMVRRRAFLPDEFHELLHASQEYDGLLNRPFPFSIVLKTLLVTGSRPGAIFKACIGDIERGRIVLPPGNGKKRNGMATIPTEFEAELRRYFTVRGNPDDDAPLLVSAEGMRLILRNASRDFRRALILSAVRRLWPQRENLDDATNPLNVAELIFSGRHRGFDGAPPKDPEKIAKRNRQTESTETIARKIGAAVSRWLEGRDMYALRSTHVSWARRLTNADSVKLQVGHAPQDVEERHYLDLVDARESSRAVWDVLTRARTLDGKTRKTIPLALAAGAENFQEVDYERPNGQKTTSQPSKSSSQVGIGESSCKNAPWRTRTSDPVIKRRRSYSENGQR